MAVLDQLGAYLAAQGCGTVGSDLFLGMMPEKSGTILGLLEYGGEPSIQTMRRPALQTVRLQICGRGEQYALTRARVARVYALLDGYRGDAMPGIYWIEALAPVFRIGKDANSRELVAFNLRAHVAHPAPVGVGGLDSGSVGVTEVGVQS